MPQFIDENKAFKKSKYAVSHAGEGQNQTSAPNFERESACI